MDRKEFLSLIGLGATSIFAATCLGGCSKAASGYTGSAPSNVDISLDLSLPVNASLNTSGGYLYTGGIIVAKTTAGTFIAVSQACTHEGVSVQYQGPNQRFYCPSHGATFSNTGAVTAGPASVALKQYNTSLNGNLLRIYS
ncbi:MAG: Rieske (2Fe-2S) iron-sulfur domain protein [Ferruginibacter sp.]|nr:Rieske (2Fe-2S) iron-sulfur domain protein [Ferruginibacter sp.]